MRTGPSKPDSIEYEYVIQTNPNLVLCNTTNLNTPQCTALQPFKFGQWNQVPYSGLGGSPTEWFSVYPSIDTADGLVKAVIDGAAQATNGFAYQHENVSFQPTNSFLLHDWWSVHGIIDPITQGNQGSCTVSAASEKGSTLSLLWGNGFNGANPYSGSCGSDYAYSAPGTVFNGPVFSDDPMFVCSFGVAGSVNIGPASPWLGVTTVAPNAFTNQGCGQGNPTLNYNVAKTLLNQPQSTPPDAVSATNKLASVAAENGCLYSGPTSIVFDGTNASGVGQYIVDSPETPLITVSGVIEDKNNDLLKNTNPCVPQTAGQPVQLPNNGVILVQTASSCSNPLDAATTIVGSYFGSTATPKCEGNAIVGNKVYDATTPSNDVGLSGSLTVAAANDVIIDNSITYNDCGTTPPGNFGASSCQIGATANDILGLIATSFVDLNHPLSGNNNAALCGTGGGLTCDLSNPRLDAVILALQHDFAVNNFTKGVPLGTIANNGSMDQYFADIEGTGSTSGLTSGYLNDYNWDQRLSILSPPYYLSPGTNAWSVAALTVNSGSKSANAPAALP